MHITLQCGALGQSCEVVWLVHGNDHPPAACTGIQATGHSGDACRPAHGRKAGQLYFAADDRKIKPLGDIQRGSLRINGPRHGFHEPAQHGQRHLRFNFSLFNAVRKKQRLPNARVLVLFHFDSADAQIIRSNKASIRKILTPLLQTRISALYLSIKILLLRR